MTHSLIRISFLASVFLSLGCSEKSAFVLPGENGNGVRTISNQPTDLITINSLYIARPTEERQVIEQGDARQEDLYGTLIRAAQAELTMEVKKAGDNDGDAIGAATKAGADSALVTSIQRYQEREGSAVGANRRAAASFSMKIIRLSDKRVVWSSSYAFNDTPFNENVLGYQGSVAEKGGNSGWGTAARAVENGFRQALRQFNDMRTRQFSAK